MGETILHKSLMLPELSFWVIKSNWPAKNNILKVLPGILGIKVGSVCLWGLKIAQDNLILDLQCSIVFFSHVSSVHCLLQLSLSSQNIFLLVSFLGMALSGQFCS